MEDTDWVPYCYQIYFHDPLRGIRFSIWFSARNGLVQDREKLAWLGTKRLQKLYPNICMRNLSVVRIEQCWARSAHTGLEGNCGPEQLYDPNVDIDMSTTEKAPPTGKEKEVLLPKKAPFHRYRWN